MIFYEGEFPADAYIGCSESEDSKKFWYTKDVYKKIEESEAAGNELSADWIDWSTGDITIGNESFSPLNEVTYESSAGGSSSDGGAVIVLAAVGAAAAATGVYLYTHPEKVEAIKDFFADLSANVQAKVQQLTANVKGAFGIVVPDSEDEEAEPAVAVVEEAQAA